MGRQELSEHPRTTKSRGYEMRKRADDVGRTRRRIVEAAVELHGTAGPALTSIAAIAERAGVTRLTVYRHFPDETALFQACSGHWMSQQKLPAPEKWSAIEDPLERLRVGLADLYRFYRDAEQMLTLVARDAHAIPQPIRAAREATTKQHLAVLTAAWPPPANPLRQAAVAHATSFTTWRSLCRDQALTNPQAVDLMTTLVQTLH
ncbi:TetR/AcrR family transcriptional regulator [Kribbella solani]|uniref:TetR/AcrR family transcriptional regulator n=1 Tax=Kribbella solani TaxID=236067 RepID=UPI0029BDBFFB|nr:helix-turn-helix domain-containing protein [Kribbella solani]MDX2974592.1 helix-turn-helix domain containing protein [Kribbella solani]